LDDLEGVCLERALCDDEARKSQVLFSLFARIGHRLSVRHFRYVLVSQGEDTAATLDVLKVLVVVIHGLFLHKLLEHFWGTLAENSE